MQLATAPEFVQLQPQQQQQLTRKMLNHALEFALSSRLHLSKEVVERLRTYTTKVPKDKLIKARYHYLLSAIYYFEGNLPEAIKASNDSLSLFEESNDITGQAEALSNLSMAKWATGERVEAMQQCLKAVSLFNESEDKTREAFALYLLGSHFMDLGDHEKARMYFAQGYESACQHHPEKSPIRARNLIGIGDILMAQAEYEMALVYLEEARKIQIEVGDKIGLSRALHELGRLYYHKKDLARAEEYLQESRKIRELLKDSQPLISTWIALAEVRIAQGATADALDYLQAAKVAAEKAKAKAKLSSIHRLLGNIYKQQGNAAAALAEFEQFYTLKEEVSGQSTSLQLKNLQTRFDLEKSEQEAEIYRLKNVELRAAYREIAQKNRQITDSINYAKRIQQAILPPKHRLEAYHIESFIFFRPKDIVSGDFYWFEEKDGKLFIAAVDCTGHGVPGAFMSLIASNLLNQIVLQNDITEPRDILNQLDKAIQQALRKDETHNRDGLDIAMIVIDPQAQTITYAGAKNPLIYVQGNTLKQIKGGAVSVGEAQSVAYQFEQHQIPLVAGTMLYLFSDGYQDQFGGLKGKKFMKKRFRNLLYDLSSQELPKQEQLLKNTLKHWQNPTPQQQYEQVDDILVIAIKIN